MDEASCYKLPNGRLPRNDEVMELSGSPKKGILLTYLAVVLYVLYQFQHFIMQYQPHPSL